MPVRLELWPPSRRPNDTLNPDEYEHAMLVLNAAKDFLEAITLFEVRVVGDKRHDNHAGKPLKVLSSPLPEKGALTKPHRLVLLRNSLKLKQADLATLIGVSSITISRWESGHHDPTRTAWQKFEEIERLGTAAKSVIMNAGLPKNGRKLKHTESFTKAMGETLRRLGERG